MAAARDFGDLLVDAAHAVPGKYALVEAEGRTLTYAGLEEAVARVGTGLGRLGVVAGQRVLICLTNRIEFVVTYLAVLRAQAVAVPMNPVATVAEAAWVLADSGSRVGVVEESSAAAVREAVRLVARARAGEPTGLDAEVIGRAQEVRVVTVGVAPEPGDTTYDVLAATRPDPILPLPDPEKLAALLYTPGTSGRPRGAMLTHRALLANIEQVAAVDPPMVHGDDVVLGMLPLFHVYGLNAVLGTVLHRRAKLVLQDGFDPLSTLDLIEDEAVSVVPAAPPVFGRWLPVDGLAERLGPVRLMLSGSAPLAGEVVEQITALTGIPVHQGYGLTEAAPVVTSTLCGAGDQPGSLGRPLPGVEVRVVDEDGHPVSGDDPGEIEIRGDNLFSGYWPDGTGGPGEDGWWPTGDLGYLDAHDELRLVDRIEELVVVSGFNVYPHEVEDVIKTVPGVRDAAVIGVTEEDAGAAVIAYVVAAEDAEGLVERVAEACRTALARFKQPARIEVVPTLPRTATGRVQKGRLRGIERRRALELLE